MKKILFACLLAACGESTGGHLISVGFEAGGVERDVTQPLTFTTTSGWTVTLTQARAMLGPFYFNQSAADPNNFRGGVFFVQATEQVEIDALNPNLQVVSGGADGVSGSVQSAEVDFYSKNYNATVALEPPLLGADLQGQEVEGTAYVAGSANRNGVTVAFAGRIVIDNNVTNSHYSLGLASCVPGAVAKLDFATQTKSVTLRVDPRLWFSSQPNFCDLVPGSRGATCAPDPTQVYNWTSANGDPTSAFHSALWQGLRSSAGAYEFSLQ